MTGAWRNRRVRWLAPYDDQEDISRTDGRPTGRPDMSTFARSDRPQDSLRANLRAKAMALELSMILSLAEQGRSIVADFSGLTNCTRYARQKGR